MKVWNCAVNTPFVPLSFARATWTGDWAPGATRPTVEAYEEIAKRPPSLVIFDLYPVQCQRIPHGRFVVPSEFLIRHLRRCNRNLLRAGNGIIDEYYVEHDHLVEVLTAPLREDGKIAIDRAKRTFEAADYLCDTTSTHQAGVEAVKLNHKRNPEHFRKFRKQQL